MRGTRTVASFAKLVGVTPLTVRRWELPDGNKEARRPRGKILAALRELEENEHHVGARVTRHSGPESSLRADILADFEVDEQKVTPLLERLYAERWDRIEMELLELLASGGLSTEPGRALASLGLAHVHIFGRFDIRSAEIVLLPILRDIESKAWPTSVVALAHTLGAYLFSAFDARVHDPGRVNLHAARALQLLPKHAAEPRTVVAGALIQSARFAPVDWLASVIEENRPALEASTSPLARYFLSSIRAAEALNAGDKESEERFRSQVRSDVGRLGLEAHFLVVKGFHWQNMQQLGAKPDAFLTIGDTTRETLRARSLPMSEAVLVTLTTEIDALCRLGRVAEAAKRAEEAMAGAKRAGLARHCLAGLMARLYVLQGRVSELGSLAADFRADGPFLLRSTSDLHATLVEAHQARYQGAHARAVELAERICGASESAVGVQYLRHDAFVDLVHAHISLGDVERARLALQRAERFLEDQPSAMYKALMLRASGYLRMLEGDFDAARQTLAVALAAFDSLGDVIRGALTRCSAAILAMASGAPDGVAQREEAIRELGRYCHVGPELFEQGQELAAPVTVFPNVWRSPSPLERLEVAIGRLSIQKPTDDLEQLLDAILRDLFVGREPVVGGDAAATIAMVDDAATVRIGLEGSIDAEERALLSLLALAVPLVRRPPPHLVTDAEVESMLPRFIAAASATKQLKSAVVRLARSTATVLITGESGSGKEVVARAIHDTSRRAKNPYVVCNCASIPRELFESQLFGHRKGAFTGAVHDSLGVVRAADHGTLFLDEIGELPLDMQPKLLRFLENAEVLPVGEQKPRHVDVRVLAATHRDLALDVREGRFREDLYYRLNVVPPLRERREDIVVLARSFTTRLAHPGTLPPDLSPGAIEALIDHDWPGNVRELRNVIERAMAYAPVPKTLDTEHLRIGAER